MNQQQQASPYFQPQNARQSAAPQFVMSSPDPIPKQQTCGTIIAAILLFYSYLKLFESLQIIVAVIKESSPQMTIYLVTMAFGLTAAVSLVYFFSKVLGDKTYLAGKPGYKPFLPLGVVTICSIVLAIIRLIWFTDHVSSTDVTVGFLADLIFIGLSYAAYSQDDFGGSACLCLKPFVMVKPPVVPIYSYPGYGYPPQQQQQVPVYQVQNQV